LSGWYIREERAEPFRHLHQRAEPFPRNPCNRHPHPEGGGKAPEGARRRRKALAAMAEMIGAIVLARAIDDEALSAQLLDAVREDLIDRSAEG
jgi:hypothetical protein